jgi:hypothetical protein
MFMRERASRWGPIMVYYFRRAQEQSTANVRRYFVPTTPLREMFLGDSGRATPCCDCIASRHAKILNVSQRIPEGGKQCSPSGCCDDSYLTGTTAARG